MNNNTFNALNRKPKKCVLFTKGAYNQFINWFGHALIVLSKFCSVFFLFTVDKISNKAKTKINHRLWFLGECFSWISATQTNRGVNKPKTVAKHTKSIIVYYVFSGGSQCDQKHKHGTIYVDQFSLINTCSWCLLPRQSDSVWAIFAFPNFFSLFVYSFFNHFSPFFNIRPILLFYIISRGISLLNLISMNCRLLFLWSICTRWS